MEPGPTPLTMAMAVSVLQLYEGLVEAYGMAPMAFVVRVGEDVRGFYWITANGTGAGVDVVSYDHFRRWRELCFARGVGSVMIAVPTSTGLFSTSSCNRPKGSFLRIFQRPSFQNFHSHASILA